MLKHLLIFWKDKIKKYKLNKNEVMTNYMSLPLIY